jgi:hypothetical protein
MSKRRCRNHWRRPLQQQDDSAQVGWANIWYAVLAVGWPVVILVIAGPDPEVLLSRLQERNRIIPFFSGSRVLGLD